MISPAQNGDPDSGWCKSVQVKELTPILPGHSSIPPPPFLDKVQPHARSHPVLPCISVSILIETEAIKHDRVYRTSLRLGIELPQQRVYCFTIG